MTDHRRHGRFIIGDERVESIGSKVVHQRQDRQDIRVLLEFGRITLTKQPQCEAVHPVLEHPFDHLALAAHVGRARQVQRSHAAPADFLVHGEHDLAPERIEEPGDDKPDGSAAQARERPGAGVRPVAQFSGRLQNALACAVANVTLAAQGA